jgi:hypothetical protein
MGAVQTGGHIDNACFAYGTAPGRQTITITFESRLYQVTGSRHGIWAFIATTTNPGEPGHPVPAT